LPVGWRVGSEPPCLVKAAHSRHCD
jgi:hypothetical protein